MRRNTILGDSKLVAFIPTRDMTQGRAFYEAVLGLRLVSDDAPFAQVFDANGTMLRVTAVGEFTPDPFTVLGWQVDSIENTAERLAASGITLLRYTGMNDNDPQGIWTSPAGARIAWFHDPDGNVLSITEFPHRAS
jgi:catechol 2,3-dioxygenase-like lactoylglutathione lyase family enzyme